MYCAFRATKMLYSTTDLLSQAIRPPVHSIAVCSSSLILCFLFTPCHWSFVPIVVSVEFAEASYTESEASMSVELCVNLTGQLEREVVVQLSTVDGGDATAGEDYLSLTETLTFVEHQESICRHLVILNDSLIENNEIVMISLSSNDSAVNVTSSTINVLILDSNSKIYTKL